MWQWGSAGEKDLVTRRPPRLPHDLLDRQALYDRLDLLAPLTVVRGPAGAGKSALVAAWAARRSTDHAVGWLGFDAETDHDTFWRQVHAAVTEQATGETSDSSRVADVVDAARALTEPLVLVLDDLHNVDPVVDEGLAKLTRECARLHLVVCLRGGHELGSATSDVPSTVLIGRSDLLVGPDETAALAERSGSALTPGEAAGIHGATGGWLGPTRAALVAIGAAPPQRRLESALAAAESFVLHTIASDVPAGIRSALLEPCSVVDGFTTGLAAALSGAESVEALLAEAEAHGLVTVEPVDGRRVYRMLPVLRDAMARELRTGSPERYRHAHERAARWYLGDGATQRAVSHAAAAEQWQLVAEIVDSAFASLVTEHPFQLHQAMKDMPDEAVADRPRLKAARTMALAVPGIRGPAAAAYKPAPPSRPAAGEAVSLADAVLLATARAVALRTSYDFAASCHVLDEIDVKIGETVDGASPDLDDVLASLQLQWAICRFLAADAVTATRDFSRAFYGARRAQADFVARNASAALGLVAAIHGDLPNAAEWQESEPTFRLDRPAADLVRTWGDTARCLRAVELLDERLADETDAATSDGTRPDELWPVVCYAGAQYALVFGEPMTMLGRINTAEQMQAGGCREPGLGGVLLAAAKTDLLLALGQGNRAQQAAWEGGLAHPMIEVSRARVELLSGDLDGARMRAAGLIWATDTDHRTRLDMLLIDAVAALRGGDEATGLEMAARALSVAGGTGAIRPFAWIPPSDREHLLAPLADGRSVLDRLAELKIRDVFPSTVEVVSLSDREQVVLEQLARTSSVEQIAETLVVSANTVKTQRRSLYRKLGVRRREEALTAAYRHGLLGPQG